MDFPISVPSIGLVDGKFADEDPLGGTPGSLIPSQWGNAVTLEILNVIEAGGLTPDEEDNTQLLAAIASITAARLAAGGPAVGTTANLRITVAAASATATVTADEIVVKSALGGRTRTLAGFNKALNIASVGALGMDTGAAPANGWLAIYAGLNEANGSTTVFAQSVGNTIAPLVYGGANAPAGITATALLTVVPTNGSSQIKVCAVRGKKVGIVLAQAYTVTGSVANQIVSAASIIPGNAIEVFGELQFGSSALSAMSLTVNSDTSQVNQQIGSSTLGAGNTDSRNFSGLTITTPQQFLASTTSTGGSPSFTVYFSGYWI